MKRHLLTAPLLLSAAVAATLPAHADTPRVAVFSQFDFPYNNVQAPPSPKHIVADLKAAGIDADLLDVDSLADRAKLNGSRYSAVVLPYGNAFPRPAFANLKAFHAAGGCLIMNGVPFTHGQERRPNGEWYDVGHSDIPARFSPQGIGVGGFHFGPAGPIVPAPGDPLGLAGLKIDWGAADTVQTLDDTTLPGQDKIIPALTSDGNAPVAVWIVHHGDGYDGAVDFWATQAMREENASNTFATEQLLTRGTIGALAQKGLLTPTQRTRALAALDAMPAPFVPMMETIPTPPRGYASLQPKSPPPARRLYVADGRKLKHDEVVALATLQGIVNRTQPRIYIIWKNEDQFWLDEMRRRGQTGAPIPVANPMSLFRTFRSSVKGAVVPDPKVYVTPDIAADIAGIDDLVVALTPELAKRLDLPIKRDLRGEFKDNADALRYARTKLLPHLNQYLSLVCAPNVLGSQLDDVVAARGMVFWVTGISAQNLPGADKDAETLELEKTFAVLPINAIVRGYWWAGNLVGLDETPGVNLASRYGKITTVSDYVGNFSVKSGFTLNSLKQKPQSPAPTYDPGKVYLAITVTDGDNLSAWNEYFRQFFTDPLHGTFPVAFGMAPTLMELAPTEMEWYYNHALPTDEFICDVSGVGYINPDEWGASIRDRDAAYRAYYKLTQQYMDRADLHTIRLNLPSRQDILRAADSLPHVDFLMPDYLYAGESPYSNITYTLPNGKAVFRGITNTEAVNMAAQIKERVGTTRPAFINAVVVNWGLRLADLKTMLDQLGPGYVAVTPTQLNALYKQAGK